MIRMQTILEVADNSGARKIACIQPLGGSSVGRTAGVGDIISASVKEAVPRGTVKKGEVVRAVIVRTKPRKRHRKDGSYIRFDNNAAVLIDVPTMSLSVRAFLGRWLASCVTGASCASFRSPRRCSSHGTQPRILSKNDQIYVLTGKDRGKTGRVMKVYPDEKR